jgi:hypothetical protein
VALSGIDDGACGADFLLFGDGVQRKLVPCGLDDNGGIPGYLGSSTMMLS